MTGKKSCEDLRSMRLAKKVLRAYLGDLKRFKPGYSQNQYWRGSICSELILRQQLPK